MGFLDFGFGHTARNHVFRASVNNWRSKVETPDPENLEELPFTDPHYYSSSESDEEDTASESAQPVLERAQESAQPILEKSEDSSQSILEDPQTEYPLIAQAPALLPPIRHPRAPLVMQKYDYSNVVYSQWSQWEGQQPKQPKYNPTYSRRYVGASTDDSGYKRMIGPVRYTRYNLNGTDVQYSDESDDDNEDENNGIYFGYQCDQDFNRS